MLFEIIPPELDTEPFLAAWKEWTKYRREIRKTMKPSTRKRQLSFLAKQGLDDAIVIIEHSIMQGWTGLFPLNGESHGRRSSSRHSTEVPRPGQQEAARADERADL